MKELSIKDWMNQYRWNMYSLSGEMNKRGIDLTPQVYVTAMSVQNWRNEKHTPFKRVRGLLQDIAKEDNVLLIF